MWGRISDVLMIKPCLPIYLHFDIRVFFLNEGIPPHFCDPTSQRDDIRPSVVCSMRGDVLSNEANSCWEIHIVILFIFILTLSLQQTKKKLFMITLHINTYPSDHLSEHHPLMNPHLVTAHILGDVYARQQHLLFKQSADDTENSELF